MNIEDYGNIRSSYNTNGLGTSGCCSAQLEFDIYDETGRICDSISRFAKVKLSGSGFISQDFFVTARTSANHVCHCVCYDRICMLDKPFYCDINWEETEDVDGQYVYEQIAEQCGFD